MAFHLHPFATLPWLPGAHPLEQKRVRAGGYLVQLRFEPGFEDPNRCVTGHTLIVLEGELTLLADTGEALRVPAGQVCVVEQGAGHRAANRGATAVVLFAIQHELPAAGPEAGGT